MRGKLEGGPEGWQIMPHRKVGHATYPHVPLPHGNGLEVVEVEAVSSFGGAPPPGMGWKIPLAPLENYC
jgi:hypothetical protein